MNFTQSQNHEFRFKNFGIRSPELWNQVKFHPIPKADEPTVSCLTLRKVPFLIFHQTTLMQELYQANLLSKIEQASQAEHGRQGAFPI